MNQTDKLAIVEKIKAAGQAKFMNMLAKLEPEQQVQIMAALQSLATVPATLKEQVVTQLKGDASNIPNMMRAFFGGLAGISASLESGKDNGDDE